MGRRTAWWRLAVVGIALGAVAGAPGSPGFAASASPSTSPPPLRPSSPLLRPPLLLLPPLRLPRTTSPRTPRRSPERRTPRTPRALNPARRTGVRCRVTARSTTASNSTARRPCTSPRRPYPRRTWRSPPPKASGCPCRTPTAVPAPQRTPPASAPAAARVPSPRGALVSSPRAGRCARAAGTYYVVVERVLRTESSPVAWDLELAPVLEPRLRKAGSTSAPETWDSATPSPPAGDAVRVRGGGGSARRPRWSKESGATT